MFYIIVAFISIIFCLLGFLLSKLYMFRYNPDNEKSSIFECGFFPKNDPPIKYKIEYIMIGLTFLVFDLELLLIFPFVFEIANPTTIGS